MNAVAPEVREALREISGGATDDLAAKRLIPQLAKQPHCTARIEQLVASLPTRHSLVQGDARHLDFLPDESVQLVLTSPPYWTLKEYIGSDGQLGDVQDYEEFTTELGRVWKQCRRVLVPGGRLIVVVGDVCLSRKLHGRHAVVPLHASIQESCRRIGFDNLAPIIWHKIANARFEVEGQGGFLGKPYEPNGVIKNDIEFILMQRKGGGYRKPSVEARLLSLISERDHRSWYRQVWTMGGASTKDHPAPFPISLAERLVRMFSFAGDTVLDPFVGTGTTMLAAARWGRNSVGVEIEPSYVRHAERRLRDDMSGLMSNISLDVERL